MFYSLLALIIDNFGYIPVLAVCYLCILAIG